MRASRRFLNLAYLLYRDELGLPARERHKMASDHTAQILATADPPVHGEHKKIISPEFSPKRIATLSPHLIEMTQQRLAAGLASGKMEFMSQLANLIPIEIVSELIAFKESNAEALFRAAIVQTDMLAAALSKEELHAKLAFSGEIFAWMFQQLQKAAEAPAAGILGLLAAAMKSNEIDPLVAMGILMTLFAAGGEPTSSLIGNTVFMLATDSERQQQLRANNDLIPKFIEEVLRLESPFRYHMRLASRPSKLCGVDVPEGATILLFWGAANRDPAEFDCPDEVDLNRARRHVGFGSGIHTCIGNTLARLETRIVIQTLLAATAEFGLLDDEETKWVPSLAVRRLHSLPIRLNRR
jgi:cytochrome P450